MSRFLNNKYKKLEAYVPGEQPKDMKYIKLNTNESPYPPSPEVLRSINAEEISRLRLYPDPDCIRFREKLAKLYGVGKDNVFLSNGSDDILNFAFMAFCDSGAAFADITYGFYPVFAELHGVDYRLIPLKEDFTIDPMDYCGLNRAVFIANPNAPTGIALSTADIEKIAAANPDNVVVVDEAYVDFGGESCVLLTEKYDNILVCATFSKSRSMAGARLGFAVGNKNLIDDLERIKFSTNPYSINRLTLKAGEAAVDSNDYYKENCQKIIKTREYTAKTLRGMGFSVIDSKANFIFAKKDGIGGGELYEQLKRRGILIRHFSKNRISEYNRITIGTQEEMEIFLQTVKEVVC